MWLCPLESFACIKQRKATKPLIAGRSLDGDKCGRLKAILLLALSLASATLASCGPTAAYNVADTAKISINGQTLSQTMSYHCEYFADNGTSIGETLGNIAQYGDPHWFLLPNNSIFIFAFNSCQWLKTPTIGSYVNLNLDQTRLGYGYLFNDTSNPTILDLIDMNTASIDGESFRFVSDRFVAVDNATKSNFKSTFPGLKIIADEANIRGAIESAGYLAPLSTGTYVGAIASLFKLPLNASCGPTEGANGPLPEVSPCAMLQICDPHSLSSETIPCLEKISDLDMTPDNNFDTMRVSTSKNQHLADRQRFYRATYVSSKLTPSSDHSIWQPRVCVDGSCGRPARRNAFHIYFYIASKNEIVIISLRNMTVSPNIISGLKASS